MIRNLGIGAKVLIVLSAVAITAVGINGYLGYNTAKVSLEAESFNKLTAVREMKAGQIEDYFQQIADQVQTFSEDRMIIEAVKAFRDGFNAIEAELEGTEETPQHVDADLKDYYDQEFQPRLQRNSDVEVSVEKFWPAKSPTRFLQHLYLSSNEFETGSKHQLDDAADGSSYSKAHAIYHPIIRNYLEKFGYYDIFLVDHETGHIVYTVFKEVDYGTSLLTGPYKETNFADAFRAARSADSSDFVRLFDFAPYEPSYNAPAAFISSPIFEDGEIIGVLLFQMPIDRINDIMTNKHAWADVGLGSSGETYLVGEDYLLRNQSRFLIEDSRNYFAMIRDIGLPEQTINRIQNLDSTIGLQPVKTAGTQAALSGQTGTQIFPDYRGVSVLSSYKPLSIADVNWVIMSEIDEAEAFASVRSLRDSIYMSLTVLVVAIIIVAVFFARSITQPLKSLTGNVTQLEQGNLNVTIDIDGRDEIGVLARAFYAMQGSIRRLVGELKTLNEELEQKVIDRTEKLSQQKDLMENTIESLAHPFYVVDANDYTIQLANSAARNLGIGELSTCHKLTHKSDTPCDSAEDPCPLEEVKKTKKPVVVEHIHYDAEGNARFCEVHGYPIFNEAGDVAQMIEYSLDITERKEAETRIRESEERLRSIIDTAVDGIIVVDSEGLIVEFSPAAERIFGYDRDEVIGRNVMMLMPESYRDLHANAMARYVAGNPAKIIGKQVEVSGLRKDGSVFPLDLSVADASVGGERLFTGILRDTTDRKLVEARLKLQATALESAANAIVITDAAGTIEWVNPAFTELTGYSYDEAKGQTPRLLKSGKQDAAFYEDLWGTISKGEIWQGELVNKRKDGGLYEEQMAIAPVQGDQGQILNFVAIKQDVTARKQAERALATQLALTRSLVDTLPNPVFVKDPETRFVLFNRAYEEAFGMKREDYLGKTVMDLDYVPVEARKQFQVEDEEVIKNGGMRYHERELVLADGKTHSALYWVTRFELDDGSVGGLVGILVDITEQKELEKELAKANKRMKGELDIGREIQMSMLPLIFPAFPDKAEFSVHADLHPAREVGGDFYDFFFLNDDLFCFCIGDVSDKGVPAALLMAVTKTLIKSRSSDDFSPASVLSHVNDEVSRENKACMFVTVFLAVLNIKTGELVYANAGHNPPYILRENHSLQRLDKTHGVVVGAVNGVAYQQECEKLSPGDTLLLYTDGVTEALNRSGELFSEKRLVDMLESRKYESAEDMVHSVVRTVQEFEKDAVQADDVTVMSVGFLGPQDGVRTDGFGVTIKNRPAEIDRIASRFADFADKHAIAESVRRQVSMAFDELLHNIMSYAYTDDEPHDIEIGLELAGDILTIRISDDGIPFNPFGLTDPDTTLSLEDREVGGLGIHLVRNVMDEIAYERRIDQNIVKLIKRVASDDTHGNETGA